MWRPRPPAFWDHEGGGLLPWLLSPAAALVARATARRVARPGWRAPVPVICVGNAGVGGAGKTSLVLDLARRARLLGASPHLLTRGYGGRARRAMRVDPERQEARLVGDEALLLAACAPCWVGADRAAAARLAIAAGADLLIMDDGLQNPGLVKDMSLLVIDGAVGFGNQRVLPAGPLRETVAAACARVQAAVLIGADATRVCDKLPGDLPVLRARLVAGPELAALEGRQLVAFAGIGRPSKFFDMLTQAGMAVVGTYGFADHQLYTGHRLARLQAVAARAGALLVTTPKDFARIPAAARGMIVPVSVALAWEDEAVLTGLLACVLAGSGPA